MPHKSNTQQTGDLGVARVEVIVRETLRWEFRKQDGSTDFGIDAHIEIIEGHEVTGKLLGAQIRSGPSFFQEETTEGIIFRESLDKLEYWTRHSLPVIIVLYDPATQTAYWQHVDRSRVEITGKGWKLAVPRHNVLGAQSGLALKQISEGPTWVQRMRRLSLAKSQMMLLTTGGTIHLRGTVFTNKTIPRANVSLIGRTANGIQDFQQDWMVIWPGGWPSEVLSRIFPWAESTVEVEGVSDEDALREELLEELWDNEHGSYAEGELFGHSTELSEVREQYSEYGYEDLLTMVRDPEGFSFTGPLQLNNIGRAFLTLETFLSSSS
jgi:hypothetical protein